VVSFGVAAMDMGLGTLLGLIGYALFLVSRQLASPARPPDPAPTGRPAPFSRGAGRSAAA
jgi:hypothetical protein